MRITVTGIVHSVITRYPGSLIRGARRPCAADAPCLGVQADEGSAFTSVAVYA
jgi:hypothetical protein